MTINALRAAIRQIPRGKVATYGQIAAVAGYPGGARQVVRVLRQTPDLPWQRVVGAGGHIRLQGASAWEQRFLLEQEGVRFAGKRIPLPEFQYDFPALWRPECDTPVS